MHGAAFRPRAAGLLAGAASRPVLVHDLPLELVRYPRQVARGDLSRDIAAKPDAQDRVVMRTLFLQAPSFEGFDGGAGSRYQARRELRSFWYPTWLAQPAALVPDSKLIDAPSHGIALAEIVAQADRFDLVVVHTSAPSFSSDLAAIDALKGANPRLKAGLIGAK